MIMGTLTKIQSFDNPLMLVRKEEEQYLTRVHFTKAPDYKNFYQIILWNHAHGAAVSDELHKEKYATTAFHISPQFFSLDHRFRIDPTADGWCTIQATRSDRYLVAEADEQRQFRLEGRIIQGDQTPTANAHFRIERTGFVPEENVTYRILNRYAGKYLEVHSASLDKGAKIVLAAYAHDHKHQQWLVKKYDNPWTHRYYLQAVHSGMVLQTGNGTAYPVTQQPLLVDSFRQQQFELTETLVLKDGGGVLYSVQSILNSNSLTVRDEGGSLGYTLVTSPTPAPGTVDPFRGWEILVA